MTKRKGLFDIGMDVRELIEELPNASSPSSKTENTIDYYANHTDSILISQKVLLLNRNLILMKSQHCWLFL